MADTITSDQELSSFYEAVGANVKRAREAKGLTQLELAQLIGHKSVGHVAKAELAKYDKHFSLEQLYKISKALDISISHLVNTKG